MQITRISGRPLAVLAVASKHASAAKVVHAMMRRDLRIGELLQLPSELRGPVPIHTTPKGARPPRSSPVEDTPVPEAWAPGVNELTAQFRSGERSPLELTNAVLASATRLSLDRIDPMLAWTAERARSEATAATARYREGRPRGPLDGVPFVVKEQIHARGTRRSAGARVLDGEALSETDGTCVRRLHEAGAVLIGSTVMTEFGMTPVGANPHRKMPRNPHDGTSLAGGSSTGSGVAVATGLVPLAIGADGGGSIRIPAARVGIFGLKPTWGRISRDGDASGGSVAHLGPMARSTRDLASMLDTMAGPDGADTETLAAPPLDAPFAAALARGVRGLVVGVCETELAEADPDVQLRVREGLRQLERHGAILRDVYLDLARWAPPIGYVTIAAESLAALGPVYHAHQELFSGDLRLSFAALQGFSALEYLDAARLREGLRLEMQRCFGSIDLLALPTTVRSSDRVTEDEFQHGFTDLGMVQGLCRYMFLGNLTGLPAISMPVGRGKGNMPVGMQLVADAWDEASLLAASATLERVQFARAERPELFVKL
ncbi:amidase [bacterium]|nr:MAG: amidase [bacterium]